MTAQSPVSLGAFDLGRSVPGSPAQPRPLVNIVVRKMVSSAQFQFVDQINTAILRLRSLMDHNAAAVMHVASATSCEGVSTVTRELAYAAARMRWCRTLLLDANPGGNDQSRALRCQLPDMLTRYAEHGAMEVAAIQSRECEFHAAVWQTTVPAAGNKVAGVLARLLHAAYDLILIDCPPILTHPYLPGPLGQSNRALLVVRSGAASVRNVQRAKQEIETLNGTVWGVILTGSQPAVPRSLAGTQ